MGQLELARSCRDEDELTCVGEELVERLRAIVHRARQAEAVLDERLLARAVAFEHAADLRNRLVRLVDEDDEIVGEEVEQAVGPRTRRAAVEDARVVLDAVAEAELAQHLHVELGALAESMGLEQLALVLELLAARFELVADLLECSLDRRAVGRVVRGRPDADVFELRVDLAGERVEVLDRLDLVAEEDRAKGGFRVAREDLERLAANPEGATGERLVVAVV